MWDTFLYGTAVLLILAPIGCMAWLAMLWLMLKMLGVESKEVLRELTLAEAVLFTGLGFGAAYVTGQLFGRFI